MIRLAALFFLMSAAGFAQETTAPALRPLVQVEPGADTVVVGQGLTLRLKILVPTWLPEPPGIPPLEIPDVIVREGGRSSGPISETVEGETWSGIGRTYRLYPMLPGVFTIPPYSIALTYADPETTKPVLADVPVDQVSFTATVPEEAQRLDPLIIASDLALEQVIEGGGEVLSEGDAVTRKVTATITGTSPLFLPPLVPELVSEAVQSYAGDPSVSEAQEGDVLSGVRTERVTYVAQYGGTAELPEITVSWFNVDTGTVETASVPGVTLQVDAPAAPVQSRISARQAAMLAGGAVLVLLALWILRHYVLPPLRRWQQVRRQKRETSEAWAARQVERAIGQRDLTGVLNALARWSPRCPGHESGVLDRALAGVGQARFGPGEADADWPALAAAFGEERARRLASRDAGRSLPPLNPC